MKYAHPYVRRLLLLAGILVSGLFVAGPLAPTAEAAFKGCRSDPLVILSDGTILDVSVAIGTAVSNVREVHYTIHGPPNTTLVAVVRTPMIGFTGKETFTYVSNAQPNQYVTEALVRTIDTPVEVTAYTTFANATLFNDLSITLLYKPVNGFNEQTLRYVIWR